MLVVYGTRFYGKVRACGASFTGTQFFHLYYVPLVPLGSHLVLEQDGDGSFKGIKSSFDLRSLAAAYLRVWGPLAAVLALVLGIGAIADLSDDLLAMRGVALPEVSEKLIRIAVAGFLTGLVVLATVVGTVLGYAVLGKLSNVEKQQRSVYAMHLGYFVDPADMGDARHALRERLLATIVERARGMAAMGYRVNADPVLSWPHVALDPTHGDEQLVTAAFTLARIDASLAAGARSPHQLQLEQLHEQLWQRIVRANPPYLKAHAAHG